MKSLYIIAGLALLSSCSNEVVINKFDKLPENFGGPGCVYSTNKSEFEEGNYVFIDGEGSALMKINGEDEFLEFKDYVETPKFYKSIYKNSEYTVEVATRKHKHKIAQDLSDDAEFYNQEEKASIKVDNGAKTTSIKVVGECSCC